MHLVIPHFKARGIWHEARLGTLHAIAMKAKDLESVVYDMARNNEFCYVTAR